MKRVKVRIDMGCVCEQYVYSVPERCDIRTAKPRKPRFKTEEERAEHRRKMAWRDHARKVNENFQPGDLYATLTFDDEHEVHTFAEAKRIRDNYIRRLQRLNPECVVFAYLGRGKGTSRIHMHILAKGLTEEQIGRKWGLGSVIHVRPLREHNYYKQPDGSKKDFGADFTGLANYLIGHWTPEQGGHRYKCTRNARVPQPEKPKEVKRDYSAKHPPRAPRGYELVACEGNQYGYWWFKYVRKPQPKPVGRPRKSTQLKS
jgi:hypothetical protein